MESHKLIDKLKNEANISYEEAKAALEKANGDMLDAMLYLEAEGSVAKPLVSIFYTNEQSNSITVNEISSKKYKENKDNNGRRKCISGGVFESVCRIIDTCNNIFFEIKKENTIVLNVPITVIILLLFFAFWIVIPLFILGFFFEIEFSISGNRRETNKLNSILKLMSVNIKKLKERVKKGGKNG